MQPAATILIVKSGISNHAASGIECCVFPRLDSPRGVSGNSQTMGGLPSSTSRAARKS